MVRNMDSSRSKFRCRKNIPVNTRRRNNTYGNKHKVNELQTMVRELSKKHSDAEDKLLRLHAESENQRKRLYKEKEMLRESTKYDILGSILNIYDYFSMAEKSLESNHDLSTVTEGFKLIKIEFDKLLKEYDIERINSIGEKFDPELHEAVSYEPSEEHDKDTVSCQWQCGYKVGKTLLKPAKVVVSSGKKRNEEEK
jgi:molecular chaperone GrpE